MPTPILSTPAYELPFIGAVPFSMIPRPAITQDLAMLDAIGATCVRVECSWAETETTPGVYVVPDHIEGRIAAALAAKRAVVILVDYSNPLYTANVVTPPTTASALNAYAAYAAWLVQRYSSKPNVFFEIWNEPNNPMFWQPAPNPAQYAALLKAAVPAMRAKDVHAQLMTAGVGDLPPPGIFAAPYMRDVVAAAPDLGIMHTLHPYNQTKPEDVFAYVDAYRAAASYSGKIAVTEWGYCDQWIAADGMKRAFYTARMICCAILGGWKLLTMYNLRDTGTDPNNPEHTFGLHKYDLTPKLAVTAFKTIMDALKGAYAYDAEQLPNGVYRIVLYKSGGKVTKLLWTDRTVGINHLEPMGSVDSVTDCINGQPTFRFNSGALTIGLAHTFPVMVINGEG